MLNSIEQYTHKLPTETSDNSQSKFRTEIIRKIFRMTEREDGSEKAAATQHNIDIQSAVRQTLETFQREIIQQNIWIRIYDDHANSLPAFSPEACYAVEEIIKNALERHRSSKMLAYVEISFSANETGTVVSIEDNAASLSAEEITDLPFLQICNTNVLPGGYTIQAKINGVPGEVSVRCVNNCFTRFGICLPY